MVKSKVVRTVTIGTGVAVVLVFNYVFTSLILKWNLRKSILKSIHLQSTNDIITEIDQVCTGSFNYYCLPNGDKENIYLWNLRLEKRREQWHVQMVPNMLESAKDPSLNPKKLWQIYFEPDWSCDLEKRFGNFGKGGKWVCDPYRISEIYAHSSEGCLIYSFTDGSDFTFETDIHKELPNCEIHSFAKSLSIKNTPPFVHFHPWGLSNDNQVGLSDDSKESAGIFQIMGALGHEKRVIEVLNVDIADGLIDPFIPLIDNGKINKDNLIFRQILTVFYERSSEGVGLLKGLMEKSGYVIFHKDPNILCPHKPCVEMALLKANLKIPVN
eukprot:GHVR01088670.1.p1 GENE.GHVR01088670.1~~GHVR01088670.1.p1  ORF type:complete len:335 (+),score=29.71 GHVR01088670.1:27-1007(+)